AWRRVQLLGDTLRSEELQALSDRDILRRLFAEDDVRLFEPAPVYFRCRCSRERVIGMLRSLGAEEIRSVLAERGEVEVRCDFCNRAYRFDPVDVEQLFAATPAADGSETRH
ncbi:MAG: Hsp33 family molecular chaperone HslO, partial [Steroidobacteraceae bacterium]